MSSRNIFDDNRITLRDVPDLVKFCQRRNKALMMFGGAGLGKSQIIKQVANMLFGERDDNLVDFRLADKEPSDVVGVQIPVTDDNGITRTVYAIPDFWPQDPNWKGIVFLDELLHAEPYLQKVAYQIMLDHRIGTYNFPKGAIFVGAGNRPGDGTAVSMLEAPLANRMVLVELDYDASVWLQDYALHNDVHHNVVAFIGANPGKLENYEEMLGINSPSYATPRTWVTASDALYDYDAGLLSARLTKAALQGSIGKPLTEELWYYHTRVANMVPIESIMDGSITKHTGSDASDVLWTLGSQGSIWLRKAMQNTNYTDDQIIEFASNFLKYMYENFGKHDTSSNRDFVSSIFLSFIQENSFGKAILRDGNRERLPAKLLAKYPVVMQIIQEYNANFGEDVDKIIA
uniref:MoxR ATPase n=1 Tax=Salmonella phage SalP219 TaxID=3158864 RepID=A0AAU7PIG4_9CAUD